MSTSIAELILAAPCDLDELFQQAFPRVRSLLVQDEFLAGDDRNVFERWIDEQVVPRMKRVKEEVKDHWPEPAELAADWQRALSESAAWEQSACGWWCVGQRRVRTCGALHLLAEFEQSPYMAWFTTTHGNEYERPSFAYIWYNDQVEVPEQYVDAENATVSARIESYLYLGMFLVLGYRQRPRPQDSDIVRQHLAILPKFATTESSIKRLRANCEWFADQMQL